MINWIFEFVLYSGIFYLIYFMVFRKTSFFIANRILLLSIPLLSASIPAIAPFFESIVPVDTIKVNLLPIDIIADNSYELVAGPSFNWWWIYFGGMFIYLLLMIRALLHYGSIIFHARAVSFAGYHFYTSDEAKGPFSFFDYIVIPNNLMGSNELVLLLKHEDTHRRSGHSYDNIFYNILISIFWFNPFVHLLGKELRYNHECEADKSALKETSHEVYSRMLLSSIFGTEVNLPVTTSMASPFFNSSLIKNRITMLYKKESPGWLKFSYLLIIPAVMIMGLQSCKKSEPTMEKAEHKKGATLADISQPPLFEHCSETSHKEEQMQCFNQGLTTYIQENFSYPEVAKQNGVEGRVYLQININENGEVEDSKILRSIQLPEDASEEQHDAVKILESYSINLLESLPKLKPAIANGKAVSLEYVLPINFKL